MRTIWRYGLTAVALLTLCATFAFGQSIVTGDLTGTVTDPQNAVVSGASVTLINTGTNDTQKTTTNGQGQFRFSLLQPGAYDVKVDAQGMSAAERRVTVSLGQVNTVPIKLGVAGATTTVEVTEQTPLLQTENANLATTYDTKQLADLPTPGGDITSYAYSSPGVVVNSASGYGNFSAYGLPSTANLFTVNGNDNMDPYLNLNNSGATNLTIGSNELSEVAVVSNGYTAQYGRQAGAQMNASTKSGTNAFHGNAIYWWNGRAMNSNDWFSTQSRSPRPFANNNFYQVSLGGPIVKNKLFFFVDQEQIRIELPGVTTPVYLPTPAFESATNALTGIYSPGSAPFYQQVFGLYNNAPGSSRATGVTLNDDPSGNYGCGDFASSPLNTFGLGTAATPCAQVFRSTASNTTNEWLITARVDWNISSKDKLFGRYKTDHGIQATGTDPINPIFSANSNQPAWEFQLNETHVFSGTTVNQLIVAGSWYKALFGPPALPAALKVFPTTLAFGDGAPFTNLGGTDNSYPQGRIATQYQITDDFSKTMGRHDLKFGVNFRRNLVSDYVTGVNTSGLVSINSLTDFATGQFFSNTANNGFAYGSNGPAGSSNYSQTFAAFGATRIRLYSLGLYAQDQFKMNSKLSITAALRFDRNANPACTQNCFTRFVGDFNNLPHDVTVPYNQVIKQGQSNAFPSIQPFVFAPRLGVNYSVTPNTVVRGGIGLFTDLFPAFVIDRFITQAPSVSTFVTGQSGGAIAPGAANNIFNQAFITNQAFLANYNSPNGTLAGLEAATGGAFAPPVFSNVPGKIYNPMFMEWNFEVEQQVNNNASLTLGYVGNHGLNIMAVNPFTNSYYTKAGVAGYPTNFQYLPNAAPDARFQQVATIGNPGWSNYDGLTASFKFRTGSSFQGSVNYTWSHALDTCSNNCLLPFSASTVVSIRYLTSPILPGTAYGSSDYDVRNNVTANYVYTSKSNWSNGFARAALGNWTLAGTLFFHSGYGWSPVSTSVRSDIGNATGIRNGTPLADFLGGPINQGSCSSPNTPCQLQSQFATGLTQNDFGNIQRNTLRGAGFFDTDLNVTKNFKLTERFALGVGANFFNILNHPNFDLPNNNVPAGNFGTITATVQPATTPYGAFLSVPLTGRLIQLNARLTF